MKNNMLKYIFDNRKPELRKLVVGYGVSPAKNEIDLWKKFNYVVAKFPSDVLPKLAEIHPDKNFIVSRLEKKSSACGCSGADGDYSNCEGCGGTCGEAKKEQNALSLFNNLIGDEKEKKEEPKKFSDKVADNLPIIIIGSLIVAGGLVYLGSKMGK